MFYIEILGLELILMLFPFFCYFLFMIYQKDVGKKVNDVLFDLVLYTSLYLLLKLDTSIIFIKEIMLIIPLFLSYIKDKKMTALIISVMIGTYYSYLNFDYYIIVQLGLYFVVFILNKKRKDVIGTLVLLKSLFLIYEYYYIYNNASFNLLNFLYLIIVIIVFYLIVKFMRFLLKKFEELDKIHKTISDLNEQKQMRESLFKITHEIKNPIAVCKGYLDMLDMDNREHIKRYIPIIKQEIDRTLTLMNDFLTLTRFKIEKKKIDISVLLDDVCDMLKILIRSHNMKFNHNIIDEEVYIIGDYDRLKQTLINVIKNAIESIPKNKKGFIDLSTNMKKKYIEIKISDNGLGMDRESLNKIGELFYTTKKGGSGLGIRFCKEIIEAHNGEIEYKSQKDIGTKVIIRLPIIKKS